LQGSGYFTDDDNQDNIAGAGYTKRKNLFALGRTVQMISKIDADLFNTELYLVNNVEIDVEITPNDNNFIILQAEQAQAVAPAVNPTFHFEITALKMFVKQVELIDGLALDVAKRLEKVPAKYGLRKTMMMHTFISANRTDFNQVSKFSKLRI
jgi:hypothetical protein